MTDGGKRRAQVLLVEDNLSDATLIRAILEREEDVRVTLAQDGIRGCQLVETQRWDLVVTDLNLPGRDGIDVIQTAKAHQADTPVLALSAYAAPAVTDGAYRAGANEILSKPVNGDELQETARDLLRLKILVAPQVRRILAVGVLPGDVEAGCGGSLLKRSLAGDSVSILVLATGAVGSDAEEVRMAARRASRDLGAELSLPPEDARELMDLDTMVIHLQDAVHKMRPHIIYAPSSRDVRESRQNAFKAAELSAFGAQDLLCYQAATTTLDFRPSHFEDISEFLDRKMATLSRYQSQSLGRPHLNPTLAGATARYWGRFLGYTEVEPFEVVRQNL
jgi:CheY-like chemotaxis protein/LmbE family N-acetylglucosaminyl deacetylase